MHIANADRWKTKYQRPLSLFLLSVVFLKGKTQLCKAASLGKVSVWEMRTVDDAWCTDPEKENPQVLLAIYHLSQSYLHMAKYEILEIR